MKIDILIKNGAILGSEFNSVAINESDILEIGTDLEKEYQAEQIIDATNKIIMPGFINAHSHVSMSYFKGLADDLPLMDWLQNHIWPIEKEFMSEEFIRDAALFGCGEMIKNGITTFNDMYFFGDQAAESATRAGIRAVIGEGVLDFPVANYRNVDEILAYIERMYEKYEDNELIDFAVAPHSIYTCGKENLIKARELAGRLGTFLHLHLSETKHEVEECLQKTGMRPVEYLESIGFFEEKVIAAHGIWMDENEQVIMAEHNASIVVNVSSNLKLASGFNSFKSYLENGVNISIGTDGVASNNNLSILQEIGMLAKLQKAVNDDPSILPAEEMIEIATMGGVRALGKEDQLGSIQVGKKADLILIDINNLEAQPLYDAYSHLVYSLSSEQIKDVIINGKLVMKDRKLFNIDEAELIEKAKWYREKIIDF